MSKTWVIYLVTNTANGKQYIGQTCKDNPHERWARHLDTSGCDLSALQKAILLHGEENFEFECIDESYDQYAADQLEISYVSMYGTEYPNGYNLTAGGAGCLAITTDSDEDDDEPAFDEQEESYGNFLHYEFGGDADQDNRLQADWAFSDQEVRKVLITAFPKLGSCDRQRARAGRWARVIQLYFRAHMSIGEVADEMKTTPKCMNNLIKNICNVQKGFQTNGSIRKKVRA